MPVEYKTKDVLCAAVERLAFVFDRFENVVVSVSSGKDSTVLYHLALDEAKRRGRKVRLFFLDQEAEWKSSIDQIDVMMRHNLVIPEWYQVPTMMTNATSHRDYFLDAWYEGRDWIHPRHPLAIHQIEGKYPQRFYDFFPWYELQASGSTAFLIGLRSKESLIRFRAVTSNAGYDGISWSTKTKAKHSFRFYPLYDWTFGDVWKFIADSGVSYNRVYDRLFAKYGKNMSTMRVSNLIHEKSFKALADVQEFEPETYDRLLTRLAGVHCAALYAHDETVYSTETLPATFHSWRDYRDYLVASTPIAKIGRFTKRFAKQATDEMTCRMQCRQVLLNDWENNVPVNRPKAERLRELWWDRL